MRYIKSIIPQSIKNIYHLTRAVLANIFYGFPSRKLKVIGVTGTNGKTTTCQMITKILEESGRSVSMASTINFKLGDQEWVNVTKYTTLSPFSTQKFIKKAVASGCDYLVLETSSHSLDQYRVWGIRYAVAVITNVTREHLDYHKTIGQYREAKKKLFKRVKIAVVNLDMENPAEFLQYDNEKKLTYSLKNNKADVFAEDIELGIKNSKFKIGNSKFVLNLPSEFNVENSLAAATVCLSQNVSLEQSSKALKKMTGVSGRLENIANGKNINVMIDYAVTPDSLEKLYKYLSSVKKADNKIIAVFGSCGERDRGKRPIMGEIVSRSADYVIITNEDPYGEDPMNIINEVAAGVRNKIEGQNFWKIFDRREAIAKALALANPQDFVIVTGKGAEETMAIGDRRIPWNDRKIIEEELIKL